MNEKDIQAISELLATPKKIAIIPHRSPDGDAMGSTLGLYHFLLKLNHQPVVIAPNDFPNFLAWLPGSETVLVYENDRVSCTKVLQEAELVFTLDFNALHRTGEMEQVLNKTGWNKRAVITFELILKNLPGFRMLLGSTRLL